MLHSHPSHQQYQVMRIIAAYALAALCGKQNPTEKDITAIIESVGMQVDGARLTKFLEEMKDKVRKLPLADDLFPNMRRL